MVRILITGITGFIGTHLNELLLQKGYDVYGISNSVSKKSISKISLLDKNNLDLFFQKNKFDIVIHLASIIDSKDPMKIFNNNFFSTMNLLFACRKYNITNFIFASSHAVYGRTQYLPIDERHPTNPQSSYAICKLMEENLCRFFQYQFNLNTIILRITSVYGCKQHKSKLIPKLIINSIHKKNIILNKYKNGFQIMDIIHVNDVCNSILCCLQNIKNSGVYNIATGSSINVKEIGEILKEIHPIKISVKSLPVETNHFFYDTSKSRKNLKFKSQIRLKNQLPEIFSGYQNH
jgi:UDP-glucose 4-epimerase